MLKVVIDTNVFISGVLIEGSNPSLVIKAWKRARKYQLFITEEIIQENLKVMHRLNIDKEIITDWAKAIMENAVSVTTTRNIEAIKEDPSANKFLECAIEVQADYIISGDKHIKKLVEFEGIKIIDARKFLDIMDRHQVK